MTNDLLSLIELAYAPAPDFTTWLETVVRSAHGPLGKGAAVYAQPYYVADDGSVDLSFAQVAAGASAPPLEVARAMIALANAAPGGTAALARAYPRAPVAGSFSELSGLPGGLRSLRLPGRWPRDSIGVVAGDPSGHGVVVYSSRSRRFQLGATERVLLTRVATHLACAFRLLRRRVHHVDAVLTPAGRVDHAEPSAQDPEVRAKLASQARALDRARGRMRRADPGEALSLWQGLVDGEWSLVEQVDVDGKRYLFAKRNSPEARPWHTLTERERQVVAYAAEGQPQKAIAYALGIALPTVSNHLRSAARKVGASSRVAMIQAYSRANGRAR